MHAVCISRSVVLSPGALLSVSAGEEDAVPCPRRVPGTSVCSSLVGVHWRAARVETALVPVVLTWEFAL